MAKYYTLSLDLVWKCGYLKYNFVFLCFGVFFKKLLQFLKLLMLHHKQFNIDNRISLLIGTELFKTFRAQIDWVECQFLEQIFSQFPC